MSSHISKITQSITVILVINIILFYLVAGDAIRAVSPIIVWGIIGGVTIAGLIRLWYLYDAHRLQNRAIRAEIAEKVTTHQINGERAAWELRRDQDIAKITAGQMMAGLVHPESLDSPTFRAFATATARLAEKAMPSEAVTASLLEALEDCPNILVVGGKGTGKTTLLQHLEYRRAQVGRTVVLDSHARPAQWRGDVIGLGRDYETIRAAMVALIKKMDDRYRIYSQGQADFMPIHTFIDEFTLLPKMLKRIGYDVQSYSIPFLTEGRKVGFPCAWGVHSDRAAALGLEGAADLKECFDAIVYLKHVNGNRYGLIDYGEGSLETRFALPGPFIEGQSGPVNVAMETAAKRPTVLDLPVAATPNETESAVIEAWNETKSLSAAYRAWHQMKRGTAYTGSVNGDKINFVKAILSRRGVAKFD